MPRLSGNFDRRLFVASLLITPLAAAGPGPVRVRMLTDLGAIVIELYPDKAPISVANFLAYADRHLLDGASFYRTVGPWNDNNPATISVIQGGLNRDDSPLPSIVHETTKATGIRHNRRCDLDGPRRAGHGRGGVLHLPRR